jgi:5'-nucleotidase (lipoprotein e(P4) family)
MKETTRRYFLLTSILVLASVCSTYYITVSTVAQQGGTATAPQMGTANNEYQTGATLWMQHSAENRALAYQAFNLAKMMLDQDFRINRKKKQRRAIIVDADETVIDNTAAQAWGIKYRQTFTNENWLAWCKREEAAAIPGAVEFLTCA